MATVTLILLIIAAACFLAAALGIAARVNLVAVGLVAWVLTALLPRLF